MKWALLLTISFFSAAESEKPSATLWTRGNASAVRTKMSGKYSVLDRQSEAQYLREDGYLEPRQRNTLFRKLQIEGALKKLDEFDKDMLVMSAPHYNIAQLKKQYPMLTEKQLGALKREIGKIK